MLAAAAIDERVACGERFFAAEHEGLARLCHRMAERFARGGRLIAIGDSPADASDVRHVAVEFVHPVIVGKRALPALGAPCADAALLAGPEDILMAFGSGAEVAAAVGAARAEGALTIAFADVGAEHALRVPNRRCFHRPGAGRDRVPRALGARPRLLRAPRAARRTRRGPAPRHGRVVVPLSVPERVRARPRRRARRRRRVGAGQGGRGRRVARRDARSTAATCSRRRR